MAVVEIESGKVSGLESDGVHAFKTRFSVARE